jgi:disulfide oxidoreductase YuzD
MPEVDLTFKANIGDISQEEVSAEKRLLFDQRQPQEIIDQMEIAMGLKRPPSSLKNIDLLRKNIILEPDKEADRELLNKLLNETNRYNVIKWDSNWSRDGKLKIFIIYEEYLDKKVKDEKDSSNS